MTAPTEIHDLPLLLKPGEVAAIGRCSVNSVYSSIAAGDLRAVRLAGPHTTRIPRAAALLWLGLAEPNTTA